MRASIRGAHQVVADREGGLQGGAPMLGEAREGGHRLSAVVARQEFRGLPRHIRAGQ
jgi:hypothetical protein